MTDHTHQPETETLSTSQRDKLVTDTVKGLERVLEMNDETLDEKFAHLDTHIETYEHLRVFMLEQADTTLVDMWLESIGMHLNHAVNQDTDFARAWESADISGVSTPAHWQLDKILNNQETDYEITTLSDAITQLFEAADKVSVPHDHVESLLEVNGFTTDDEGFIIDKDTREFKEPYSFDADGDRLFHPFRELAHDTETDPLEDRLEESRQRRDNSNGPYTDRVHIDNFGGVIYPCAIANRSSREILEDRWFEMIELAAIGALTDDLTAISATSPVVTTRDLYLAYNQDAEGVFNGDHS